MMSKYQITASTDHKYIGHIILLEEEDKSVQINNDFTMSIEQRISVNNMELRIVNSNYSIDLILREEG